MNIDDLPVGLLPEPDGARHLAVQLPHLAQVQAGQHAGSRRTCQAATTLLYLGSKAHKNEDFFGSDLEFCTISL